MPYEASPAFQFYPQDFLSDDKVDLMSSAARGCYIMLICHCWLKQTLPNDPGQLARLARYTGRSWGAIWAQLTDCFRPVEGGLQQPRVEQERQKQAIFRESGRKGGRKSAKARARLRQAPIQAKSNSSSSSSSSSSDLSKKQQASSDSSGAVSRNQGNGVYVSSSIPINGKADDELGNRAARFCDRYAELYPQHRKGARYLAKPALDWPKAIDLCRTWDDERLEKLAIVFLKTDHDFAVKGSRTIGQFSALASWCDDRLRDVESGGE